MVRGLQYINRLVNGLKGCGEEGGSQGTGDREVGGAGDEEETGEVGSPIRLNPKSKSSPPDTQSKIQNLKFSFSHSPSPPSPPLPHLPSPPPLIPD